MPVTSWRRRLAARERRTAVTGDGAADVATVPDLTAAVPVRGVAAPPAPLITRRELALGGATLLVLAVAVLGSRLVQPAPPVHTAAQFVHLACAIVGLGSVLAVDWFGLRWRFGRVSLQTVVSTAATLAVPIWLGLAGLMLSGMLLRPDLGSPFTVVKLAMVGAAGVVGAFALAVSRRLAATTTPSPRLVRAGLAMAVASQLAWWTATAIGFLNRT